MQEREGLVYSFARFQGDQVIMHEYSTDELTLYFLCNVRIVPTDGKAAK